MKTMDLLLPVYKFSGIAHILLSWYILVYPNLNFSTDMCKSDTSVSTSRTSFSSSESLQEIVALRPHPIPGLPSPS